MSQEVGIPNGDLNFKQLRGIEHRPSNYCFLTFTKYLRGSISGRRWKWWYILSHTCVFVSSGVLEKLQILQKSQGVPFLFHGLCQREDVGSAYMYLLKKIYFGGHLGGYVSHTFARIFDRIYGQIFSQILIYAKFVITIYDTMQKECTHTYWFLQENA